MCVFVYVCFPSLNPQHSPLCNPIDSSPPGSPVPGILQARILEWLPFPSPMQESEKWKWSLSVLSDSYRPPWIVAYQAPPSMGFSRQEYWSGLPLPSLQHCPSHLYIYYPHFGLPRRLSGKESAHQCRRCRFNLQVGKIPWRRKCQPTAVIWARESHGRTSLVGHSTWGCKESATLWATEHASTYPHFTKEKPKSWRDAMIWPSSYSRKRKTRACSHPCFKPLIQMRTTQNTVSLSASKCVSLSRILKCRGVLISFSDCHQQRPAVCFHLAGGWKGGCSLIYKIL